MVEAALAAGPMVAAAMAVEEREAAAKVAAAKVAARARAAPLGPSAPRAVPHQLPASCSCVSSRPGAVVAVAPCGSNPPGGGTGRAAIDAAFDAGVDGGVDGGAEGGVESGVGGGCVGGVGVGGMGGGGVGSCGGSKGGGVDGGMDGALDAAALETDASDGKDLLPSELGDHWRPRERPLSSSVAGLSWSSSTVAATAAGARASEEMEAVPMPFVACGASERGAHRDDSL